MRFLLALSLCLACHTKIEEVKYIAKPRNLGYCLRGELEFRKSLQKMELCVETLVVCNRALKISKQYGGIAHLNKVAGCYRIGKEKPVLGKK